MIMTCLRLTCNVVKSFKVFGIPYNLQTQKFDKKDVVKISTYRPERVLRQYQGQIILYIYKFTHAQISIVKKSSFLSNFVSPLLSKFIIGATSIFQQFLSEGVDGNPRRSVGDCIDDIEDNKGYVYWIGESKGDCKEDGEDGILETIEGKNTREGRRSFSELFLAPKTRQRQAINPKIATKRLTQANGLPRSTKFATSSRLM